MKRHRNEISSSLSSSRHSLKQKQRSSSRKGTSKKRNESDRMAVMSSSSATAATNNDHDHHGINSNARHYQQHPKQIKHCKKRKQSHSNVIHPSNNDNNDTMKIPNKKHTNKVKDTTVSTAAAAAASPLIATACHYQTNYLPFLLKIDAAVQIYILQNSIKVHSSQKNKNQNNYIDISIHQLKSIIDKTMSMVRSSSNTTSNSSSATTDAGDENLSAVATSTPTNASTSCTRNSNPTSKSDDTQTNCIQSSNHKNDIHKKKDEFESLDVEEKILVILWFISHTINNAKSDDLGDHDGSHNDNLIVFLNSKSNASLSSKQEQLPPPPPIIRIYSTKTFTKPSSTNKIETMSRMDKMKQLYLESWYHTTNQISTTRLNTTKEKTNNTTLIESYHQIQVLSNQIKGWFHNSNTDSFRTPTNTTTCKNTTLRYKDDRGNDSQSIGFQESSKDIREVQLHGASHTETLSSLSSSSKIIEHYIKPNMTLEERVQARAAHSQHLRQQKQMKQRNNSNRNIPKDDNCDDENIDTLHFEDNNITNVLLKKQPNPTTSKKRRLEKMSLSNATNKNLVRFADALRLYVRHSTQRMQAFVGSRTYDATTRKLLSREDKKSLNGTAAATSSSKVNPQYVTISLDEIRKHLKQVVSSSNSTATTARNNPNSSSTSAVGLSEKRFTSKEVTEVIKQLCDTVPEWITMTFKKMKREESGRKSIFIRIRENISYQLVRQKLGVERTFRKNEAKAKSVGGSSTEDTNEELMTPKKLDGDVGVRTMQPNNPKVDFRHKKAAKKDDTFKVKRTPQPPTPHQQPPLQVKQILKKKVGKSNGKAGTSLFETSKKRKRSKLSLSARRNLNDKIQETAVISGASVSRYNECSTNHRKKRDDDDDDDDEDPAALLRAAGIEEKKRLRVNYYQHLTNADEEGGEVIQSTSTNPRGLKRMFSLLNAGERI